MPLTSLDWLQVGKEWPPPSEAERLERLEKNKKLWNNQHVDVYGDWWRVLREEYGVSHEIVFNFHERLSTLWAGLVFGDTPTFDAGDPVAMPAGRAQVPEPLDEPDNPNAAPDVGAIRGGEEAALAEDEGPDEDPAQSTIDRIVRDSELGAVGYEATIDQSRYGDSVFKLVLKQGRARIVAQSPAYWFPVVSRDDLREVVFHVLAWTFEEDEVTFLRAEIHAKGLIFNLLFRLAGNTIVERLSLAEWFPDRRRVEVTGLADRFMVFHAPGLRASDELHGKDDYERIDSLILERMGRASQLSKIQDKHSDPAMYGDEAYQRVNPRTGRAEFSISGGKFFPVREGMEPPGYLVWDASQDNQFTLMDKLKQDLYELSKTTPTSFGSSETGYAESGTSLRLRMVPPLDNARSIRNRMDPVVKDLLVAAAELEAAWGVPGSVVPSSINITWKDGLPKDPKEDAEIEEVRLRSGNTSRYSSIERLDGGTPEEIEEEIERIDEDRRAANEAATTPALTPEGDPVEGEEDPSRTAEGILERMRGGGGTAIASNGDLRGDG